MTLALAGTRKDAGVSHRRSQSEADLGRGLQHQGRRARPRLCGGLAGPADRASRHQPGVAQHRHVEAGAGAGGARRAAGARGPGRAGDPGRIGRAPCAAGATGAADRWRAMEPRVDSLQGALNIQGQEVLTAYAPIHAAALADVRRTAGAGSLRLALRRAAAARGRAAGGLDLRGAGRNLPGAAHGRSDPGVARRRRAHRRRRLLPAHLDQDRRRAGGPRQPVQRHGRAIAGILRRPRKQGRAAHVGTDGIAGAADRDLGSVAGHLVVAGRA